MAKETNLLSVMLKLTAFFLLISCIGLFEDQEPINARGGSSDEDTGKIIGRVVDREFRPVSGVLARLLVLDATSATDEEGYFKFTIERQRAGLSKKSTFSFQDTLTLSYKEQVFFKEPIPGFTDTLPPVVLGSIHLTGSISNCSIPITRITATFRAAEAASPPEITAKLEYNPDSNIYTGTLYYPYTSAETKYEVRISAFGRESKPLARSETFYFSGDSNRIIAPEIKMPLKQPNSFPTSRSDTVEINSESALQNTKPVFTEIDTKFAEVNKPLSFTISAFDADGDDLIYSMLAPLDTNVKAFFDSNTNTFSWTPTDRDTGKYVAIFEVADNAKPPGRDTLFVDITVTDLYNDYLVVRHLLDVNGFTSVPVDKNICEYTGERITKLFLDSSRIPGQLTILPASIQNLTELKHLELSYNNLTSLPDEIGKLINLIDLSISYNQINNFPSSIGNLTKLEKLFTVGNEITSLPSEIGNLINLTHLFIYRNQLSNLPSSIGKLTNLKLLIAYHNKLTSLPDEIGNLINLTDLGLSHNQLSRLPSEVVNLKMLKTLTVKQNNLCNLSETEKAWINTHSKESDWESTQNCP